MQGIKDAEKLIDQSLELEAGGDIEGSLKSRNAALNVLVGLSGSPALAEHPQQLLVIERLINSILNRNERVSESPAPGATSSTSTSAVKRCRRCGETEAKVQVKTKRGAILLLCDPCLKLVLNEQQARKKQKSKERQSSSSKTNHYQPGPVLLPAIHCPVCQKKYDTLLLVRSHCRLRHKDYDESNLSAVEAKQFIDFVTEQFEGAAFWRPSCQRSESQFLLEDAPIGSFIVRRSSSQPLALALSVRLESAIRHYSVLFDIIDNSWTLQCQEPVSAPDFPTLLVEVEKILSLPPGVFRGLDGRPQKPQPSVLSPSSRAGAGTRSAAAMRPTVAAEQNKLKRLQLSAASADQRRRSVLGSPASGTFLRAVSKERETSGDAAGMNASASSGDLYVALPVSSGDLSHSSTLRAKLPPPIQPDSVEVDERESETLRLRLELTLNKINAFDDDFCDYEDADVGELTDADFEGDGYLALPSAPLTTSAMAPAPPSEPVAPPIPSTLTKPIDAAPAPVPQKRPKLVRNRTVRTFNAPNLNSDSTSYLSSDAAAKLPQVVTEILDSCRRKSVRYRDEDFSHLSKSSLVSPSSSAEPTSFSMPVHWARASTLPGASLFDVARGEPDDQIVQGSLGNCFFLSAISSISRSAPDLLMNCFVTTKLNPMGVFAARFFQYGHEKIIITDDYIPLNRKGQPMYGRCEGAGRTPPLWCALLEKCYAKFLGSYGHMHGGATQQAFADLTGLPTAVLLLSKSFAENPGSLCQDLSDRLHKGDFLAVARAGEERINVNSAGGNLKSLVINPAHCYSVVRADVSSNLVHLRDPWGSRGAGEFALRADHFLAAFTNLFACQKNTLPLFKSVEGTWGRGASGGCLSHASWRQNPQWRLSISSAKPVSLAICVTQHGESGPKKVWPHAGCYLISIPKLGSNPQDPVLRLELTGSSSSSLPRVTHRSKPFVDVRDAWCMADAVEPGEYAIMAATFQPGIEGKFSISLFSSASPKELNLQRALVKPEMQVQGDWVAGINDGGCLNHPKTCFKSPQYALLVKSPATLSIILSSVNKLVFKGFYVVRMGDVGSSPTPLSAIKSRKKDVVSNVKFNNLEAFDQLTLDPGLYSIIVCTFEPGKEDKYTLSLFTDLKTARGVELKKM